MKKNLPSVFTFLRYPGGKSKYIKRYLYSYIRYKNFRRFVEPFAGGASFSLFLKRDSKFENREFWINDINKYLYIFWKEMQNNSQKIYENVLSYKKEYDQEDKRKLLFDYMKNLIYKTNNDLEIAVAYYILNKLSFSGLTEQGNFTSLAWELNFSFNNIEKIKKGKSYLKDMRITNKDYKKVFKETREDDFLFIDPPYAIKNSLYGKGGKYHKNFNHEELFENISKLNCDFILTYNYNDAILNLYNKFLKDCFIDSYEFKYCMNFGKANKDGEKKSKIKEEIFISNINVKEENSRIFYNAGS